MRSLILVMILGLVGCNSSDDDSSLQQQISAVPNEATAVQALRAQVNSLQQQMESLQLIGKPKGVALQTSPDAFRTMREFAAAPVSFGPCSDMGVFQGRGGSDSANPLHSQFEIYKQTANSQTGCPGSTTSYNEVTGLHDRLPYAAWSGPNCTGTLYVETDVPQNSMSLSALENILVMMSPDPSDNTVYSSQAGSIPQSVQIQSAFNLLGGVCNSDIETRMVIPMIPNDVNITGVRDSLIPGSWNIVSP